MSSQSALAALPAEGSAGPDPSSGGPAVSKVLIVDDSPSVCLAIRRMLHPLDCRILEARSGRQALSLLEAEIPDVVLCDMLLEDVSGVELCRRLRGSGALGHVAMVLISGQAPEEMAAQAQGAGADGLLRKPFRAETLIAEIRAAVASARRSRQASPAATQAGAAVLGPAGRHLEALVRMPAFRSCSWALQNGRRGHWGAEPAGPPPIRDTEALLSDLERITEAQGLGGLPLVCLETARREVFVVGRRQGVGVLSVRLGTAACQGRARHLVRMFLRSLPRSATAPLLRKEPAE